MSKQDLRKAKEGYISFLYRVNGQTGQQLRDLIKDKFGLTPAESATDGEMRQTLQVWALDQYFPS